jgi:hypothetical protein
MADRQSDAAKPGQGASGDWLRARIGANVLRQLGQPADFQAVQVRPLWPGRFRVNVLVGGNAASVVVAHSYFLEADGEGNVVAATPALARRY